MLLLASGRSVGSMVAAAAAVKPTGGTAAAAASGQVEGVARLDGVEAGGIAWALTPAATANCFFGCACLCCSCW